MLYAAEGLRPPTPQSLLVASPHWMRPTHCDPQKSTSSTSPVTSSIPVTCCAQRATMIVPG
eukprot:scaffold142044_cov32-Tisochrysis_lutea.AAC.1